MRATLAALAMVALAGCAPVKGVGVAPLRPGVPLESYGESRPSLGGLLRIEVIAPDGKDDRVEAALEKAFQAAEHWEHLLSEEIPESPLSRINAAAGQAPVAVPPEVIRAFQDAVAVSAASKGAFDLASRVDWRKIILDEKVGTVFLPDPRMKVAFGGMGQGIVDDAAAAALREAGFDDFSCGQSGEGYFAGDAGGKPWVAQLSDPQGPPGNYLATVELRDEALTTSPDPHPTLDPRIGAPARGLASVSVLSPDASTSRGYDSAILAAGPQEGVEVLRERHLQGVLVRVPEDKEGVETLLVTSGLKSRIDLSAWKGPVEWLEVAEASR